MEFSQEANSIETFYGLIETAEDALRIFDHCREGKLGRIRRRLHDRERGMIRSGSVFCFDEVESGIRRWTDGRLWSPSRILGNFLIYREIDSKKICNKGNMSEHLETAAFNYPLESGNECQGVSPISIFGNNSQIHFNKESEEDGSNASNRLDSSWKSMSGSKPRTASTTSKDDFRPGSFKADGLIKKTISARVEGRIQHLVAYYSKKDFCASTSSELNFLPQMEELRNCPVPLDLVLTQQYRKSPQKQSLASPIQIGKRRTFPTSIKSYEGAKRGKILKLPLKSLPKFSSTNIRTQMKNESNKETRDFTNNPPKDTINDISSFMMPRTMGNIDSHKIASNPIQEISNPPSLFAPSENLIDKSFSGNIFIGIGHECEEFLKSVKFSPNGDIFFPSNSCISLLDDIY
jgi:hypothetical protein